MKHQANQLMVNNVIHLQILMMNILLLVISKKVKNSDVVLIKP